MTTTESATTPAEPLVFKIAASRMDDLTDRFARLARRAARIGVPAPTFTVVETFTVPVTAYDPSTGQDEPTGAVRTFHNVTVDGAAPSYNGWSMAAVIDRDIDEAPDGPHLVHVLDGFTLDLAWRTAPDFCDYCAAQNRPHAKGRKTLVVVEHATEGRKIVGTTCLKDFLGHAAPDAIAAWVEVLSSLRDLLGSMGDDEERFGSVEERLDPVFFLAYAAASIRRDGWVPKSAYSGTPTAYVAATDIDNIRRNRKDRNGTPLSERPEPQDVETAEKALVWAADIVVDYDTNDYLVNVATVANKQGWRARDLGIGASIVVAYHRSVETEITRARNADAFAKSVHVGEVGKRIDFAGTVVFTRSIPGMYGVTLLVKILTDDGNVFTWFASNGGPSVQVGETWREIEQGDHLVGKATVKAHDEYQGTKQTIVTRAKVTVTPEQEAVAS